MSAPNAPPSFAFDHNGNMSSGPAPQGESASKESSAPPSRFSESVMSTQLNNRWKQYESQMATHRNESALEVSRSVNSPTEREATRRYLASDTPNALPTNSAARSGTGKADLSPRQPYNFKKSQSYDTDDLIRKYGGLAGIPPTPGASAAPPAPSPITVRPSEVRDKILNLVDDEKLQTPFSVRRTESGGFRAAPAIHEEDPYSVRRVPSGNFNANNGGKRVPAALAGLSFSSKKSDPSWNNSGRYSFSDPSFKDDDHISDEEDDIVAPFRDEPVVDVGSIESRSAVTRPYSDNPYSDQKFDGDFEGGSKSWSSRYSDTSAYVSQQTVLDKWDREFEQQRNRKGARNMFMSTANSIRNSARTVVSKAGSQKQKIFGSGGFSFRANHIFGHHKPATEKPEVNLRTVWKEVEDEVVAGPPRVHKTWQEVMLNKRKRRRCMAIFTLVILAGLAAASAFTAINNRRKRFKYAGLGDKVTVYVTSDSPYDAAAEDRLQKDLYNIPPDSEFVMHLGNIQDSAVTMCSSNRYKEVASVLSKSPVPLFIVPGSEDWAKCPKPDQAYLRWIEAFLDFDMRFKHGYEVRRDPDNPEAWSFLHKGVLFMGLHIVTGPVVDEETWAATQREMVKFYFGMANLNKGSFRSIVLMGNARPSPQQTEFFNALFTNLKDHHAPMLYIHASEGDDSIMQYNPFPDHREVQVIGVHNGSMQPPRKLTIGFGEQPFVVDL